MENYELLKRSEMFSSIKQNTIAIALHRLTSYVLIAFIFGCIISYIYIANSAVRTLTVLEKTRSDKQSLGVKVSELESQRFVIDNSVDATLASNLGFVEVREATYLMKNIKSTTLSLRTP